MAETIASLAVEVSARTEDAREKLRELERLGQRFAGSIFGAFEAAALEGRNLQDVLRNVALELSALAFRAALTPLRDAASGFFGSAFQELFGFAEGGVMSRGMPVPFASGGVISTPAIFPLRGGRMGLAGEAGPEAILPLARGADGRLGVRAGGAASSVNVTVNITTPDIEGFRRNQGEISAGLARAVARGQRNL